MAYISEDNLSGYHVRFGIKREDGDGRVHMYARALSGATLGIPKVLYFNASNSLPFGGAGYFATTFFATGKASGPAAAMRSFYVGLPNEQIPSNVDAWFQVGGPYKNAQLISCSGAGANFSVMWRDATVAVGEVYSLFDPEVDTFAVMLSSNTNTGTNHDIFLFGNPMCGCTA